MRKQLAVAALGMALIAAAPGPDPIITLDGVSAAVKMSPELRTAIAPQVKSLNSMLEKIAVAHAGAAKASPQQRAHTHEAMKAHHDDCWKQIHEIMKQLDPEQRAAFHEYLHAQLKAAGIELPADHGPGSHRHGDSHGTHLPASR